MINRFLNISELRDYLIIVFIIFIYGININYLTTLDSTPPKWDEAVHLRDSFVFHNILNNPSQINLTVIKDIINKSDQYPLIRPSGYYPPLIPLTTSFLYFVFGVSAKTAIMSNLIYIIILVISIYRIGDIIFNSKLIGLLASIIILFFPIVLQHSVIYYLDLPLTGFTAFAVFTLLRTEFFTNRKFSIFSGFSFGLGMLVKWTFLFFILGPLIYVIFNAINLLPGRKESRTRFYSNKSSRNIMLFVLISLVTFGLYYFPILIPLLKETFKYSHGPLSSGPDFNFSVNSIVYYPVQLWSDMITPFSFILFTAGIIFFLASTNRYKLLMLLWLIVPYLIFTFIIQAKTPRYMMPALVPISLIISFCISKISELKILNSKFRIWKYSSILFVVVIGIYFFKESMKLNNSIIDSSKENWNVSNIISVIQKDMILCERINQPFDKPIYLGTIPDDYYINGQTIRYYAALINLPINVIKLQDYTDYASKKFVQQFDRYDYIITKSASNMAIPSFQKSTDEMNSYFYSHITSFRCLKVFSEPDSSIVSVFKKNR